MVGFAGAFWQGSAKTFRFWVAGALALTVAPLMTLSPLFLWLLLVPSLAMAIAFWFKKIPGAVLLIYVLADVCVALAVTLHHRASTEWSVPGPGTWEAGVGLLAAAALLRLGAPFVDGPRASRGLVLLGWWQGVLLAWLAGPSAAPVLILGGTALMLSYILLANGTGSGPLLAFGGVAAVLAAFGPGTLAVVAVGLAGSAFLLGDRGASIWAAVLPMSVPATLIWPSGISSPIPILIGAPVAAAALYRLAHEAKANGGALVAISAVGLSLAAVPDQTLRWLLYGVAVAGVVTLSLTKARSMAPSPMSKEPVPPDRTRAMTAVVATFLLLSVVLAVRLTLVGLSTGFL